MKLKVITLIIASVACAILQAQPSLDWQHSVGGKNGDRVHKSTMDAQGNVYIVGEYDSIVDFKTTVGGPSHILKSKGDTAKNQKGGWSWDYFVAKYSSKGDLAWVRGIGARYSPSYGAGNKSAIRVDSKGNVIVGVNVWTGVPVYGSSSVSYYKNDTCFFYDDKGTISKQFIGHTHENVYLTKYDKDGKLLWAESIGSANANEQLWDLDIDPKDDIYITGDFYDRTYLNPLDSANSTYSSFSGTFGPGADIFFAKFNKDGKYKWGKRFGGPETDYGISLDVTQNGLVYLGGVFSMTAGFNLPTVSANDSLRTKSHGYTDIDGFVAKYDTAGNFIWVRQITGNDGQFIYGVAAANNGDLYGVGTYRGISIAGYNTSNPITLSQNGITDFFISAFDSQGNLKWAKSVGGAASDICNSVSVDASNNAYISGAFYSFVLDFDTSKTNKISLILSDQSNTNQDMYIAKYDNSGTVQWAKSFVSKNMRSDDAYHIYVEQGSGDFTLSGLTVGDSIDFDLTSKTNYMVNPSNHIQGFIAKFKSCKVDFGTEKDSLVMADVYKTYQWYDCATGLKVDGATKIQFMPKNSGTYKLVVAGYEGCIDTSDCYTYVGCRIDVSTTRNVDTLTVNQSGATYQWLVRAVGTKKYVPIKGATKQDFILTNVPAEYACKITLNRGCYDTTAFTSFNDVGIHSVSTNSNISLTPNPAQNQITIMFSNNSIGNQISVCNVSGQEVIETINVTKNNYVLNIENLPNGIYSMKITNTIDNTISLKRFVKQD